MLPRDLKAEHFNRYPAEARKLVTDYLVALQALPLSFVPNLLREAIDYDFKFPAERRALERELANLQSLIAPRSTEHSPEHAAERSSEQPQEWFRGFAQIKLSPQLEQMDWVNSPAQFVEQLSTHLWATHQLDAFRKAATEYADRLHAVVPLEPPPIPRLGIAVIGQGVSAYDEPLFRKLRPHGGYFSRVKPEGGLRLLLNAIAARAQAHPIPYGHWYVDGGEEAEHFPALTCVSYHALEPVRSALLRKMRTEIAEPGMGPEALRTLLAQMNPVELGLGPAGDPVLDRFRVKLLTEGSGTQIFSTTFVQWTAREALRRAQPCTLLVRFAPRQRQKPMNELISEKEDETELDPHGSLMDADMGAYYNWINQQRLSGADQSSFLVWFENHNEAVAIGPSMPRATESSTPTDLRELLSLIT
ncbi:MAG: hypothetical protein ABSA78_19890 [Candidatus Sulfotelmatobacter sp.]|jgi:hypothetical protein